MNIYWIGLTVNFIKPISVFEADSTNSNCYASGFFQEIGCTSENEEETKKIIIEYLKQNSWLDSESSEIVFDRVGIISKNEVSSEIYGDPDVRDSLISNPLAKGIWYTSGRGFFTED